MRQFIDELGEEMRQLGIYSVTIRASDTMFCVSAQTVNRCGVSTQRDCQDALRAALAEAIKK